MSSPWTVDRVLSLAPDPGSASSGQGLASAKKWVSFAQSERAVWGLCQGSGKDPYQTRVDLSEPAFKCSCPSRKFPCKHGLGLMILFAKDGKAFKKQDEPGWVSEWLANREEKAEKKAERVKAAAEKPVDVEAQAKRAAKREANVMDGVGACRVWLDDLVRKGLGAAQTESVSAWERMAARMVDAQAPGVAGFIRRIPEVITSGEGWEVRTLDHLGRLHLLLCAAERLETLPADLAGDARVALGWTQSKEEVLAGAGVADRWAVAGQIIEEDDRLRVRRTWLVGRATGQRALVLDFAAGAQPLDPSLVAGMEFEGEVAYYPSRQPLRALVKSRGDAVKLAEDLRSAADATIEAGLERYAKSLGANPWIVQWPLVLAGVRPMGAGAPGKWLLTDGRGHAVPLRPSFAGGLSMWRMVSGTGGGTATIMAEWDGFTALPLAVLPAGKGGAFSDIAPRWAA